MNGYPGPHYAYAYEQHRRHFEPPMHPMHPHNRPSPYATYPTGPPPSQYQHMSSPYATYPADPPPPQYSHDHVPPPHAYSHVPPSPSLSSSSSVSSELAGLSSHNQTTEPAASVESGAEEAKSPASPPRSKKERLMARMATPSPSPLDANMMPPRTPSPSNSSTSTSSSAPSSPTSSPSPSKNNGKWTESEDAVLRAAVAANSARNWKKIASSLSNRSDVQCLHRWQKVLRPGLVKGPWTADEDCRLVELIQQYGVRRWSFLATQLHTGRLGKQCRERWYNHLDPVINKGPWTRAEDDAVMAAYEEMGSKWARIAKAVGNGRTDNAIKNRWNSMLRRVVKGEIARPSYADEETKEEEGQATPSTGGRQKKRSRESVDDAIDYDLLSKDRGQCTPAELDQIRRERNRLHSRRSRERKRARFAAAAAAEQNSIRKVSTATPPPPSSLTLDEHASSAPSTPSTLADAIKSIRLDLSDDDAIAAEALSILIGTTNTTKSMNHVPRPVSVTNTPSPVTSVISYSSDAESSTSTASDANRTPTVPRQRREEASTEGMSDLTLPALPSSSVVGRYPQLPLSLGATRKASSKDEFLKVVSRTSSNQGGVEDAVGLLLHFNNHTRTLQYHTGQ